VLSSVVRARHALEGMRDQTNIALRWTWKSTVLV
jgi:hypothetical protein